MIYPSPICLKCIHFREDFNGLNCDAFPKGIPDVILLGKNDHSEPLPEQKNEIVFEPIESEK